MQNFFAGVHLDKATMVETSYHLADVICKDQPAASERTVTESDVVTSCVNSNHQTFVLSLLYDKRKELP